MPLHNNYDVDTDSWCEQRARKDNATARCGNCQTLWRQAFVTLAEARQFLEHHLRQCGAPPASSTAEGVGHD